MPVLIGFAHHNISPPLGKQLVRELEGGVGFSEDWNGLPSSFCCWHTSPLNKHVPNITTKLCAEHPFRMKERPTMSKRR